MVKIRKVNKNIIIVVMLFILIITSTVTKAYDGPKANKENNISKVDSDAEAIHGTVIKVYSDSIQTDNNGERYCNADIRISSGKLRGQVITAENFVDGNATDDKNNTQSFARVGDEVLVNIDQDTKGNINSAYIYDIVRYKYLYKLSAVFIILLILIGGVKGIKSVVTLAITGLAVIKILIPLIMKGYNPIIVSVIICIFVIVINLFIVSGRNKKTLAAIIGTSGGVLIAGAIAIYSNFIIRVNGLNDDEIQSIIYTIQNPNFNFKGLFFAGIIMGALGAVMDVSMSIASAMKEIKEAKPEMTKKELIKSGMNVGKDIMGTMANTLILAYVGGAMYIIIMIASYTTSISTAINQDIIAAEILKALAGSIGLILAIPITAIASAILITKYEQKNSGVDSDYNNSIDN